MYPIFLFQLLLRLDSHDIPYPLDRFRHSSPFRRCYRSRLPTPGFQTIKTNSNKTEATFHLPRPPEEKKPLWWQGLARNHHELISMTISCESHNFQDNPRKTTICSLFPCMSQICPPTSNNLRIPNLDVRLSSKSTASIHSIQTKRSPCVSMLSIALPSFQPRRQAAKFQVHVTKKPDSLSTMSLEYTEACKWVEKM